MLIAIISYSGRGNANPSYKGLKLRSKIKKDETLIKTLNLLKEKGFLEIIGSKGRRNIYKPTPKTEYLQKRSTTENGGTTHSENGVPPTPKTEEPPTPKTEYKKENRKVNEKVNIYIPLNFIDDVIDKVNVTQEQYDKLIEKYGKQLLHDNIIALDNYIANGKGRSYKDHYRALNTWCNKNKDQAPQYQRQQSKPSAGAYRDVREGTCPTCNGKGGFKQDNKWLQCPTCEGGRKI